MFLRCAMGIVLVAFIGSAPTWALEGPKKRAVMMIGEDEYKTWETLPEFAKAEMEPRGYVVTIIQEDGANKNHFPGLIDALSKADVLIVSTRRRLPPKDQLDAIRAYLDAGKPLVGIRTACHAFSPAQGSKGKAGNDPAVGASWVEFDAQVLGGHYTGHHGPSAKVAVATAGGAADSSLLQKVDVAKLVGNGSLYKVSPLDPTCVPLLIGTIPDKPAEPLAWTHLYGEAHARVFYTSLGHPDDFKEPEFRQLLLNGIAWSLHREAFENEKPARASKLPSTLRD
jgi:type 1 glutamine amidotransferase